jgi:hypothetical protein
MSRLWATRWSPPPNSAAAWFTGSAAMLSEVIRSAVDTGHQGLLLLGLRQAAQLPVIPGGGHGAAQSVAMLGRIGFLPTDRRQGA